ncbi:MAG TPA: hypothetical protein VL463_10930 [Kofleriaceae bacterium]|nr:hypothetical protein [Kofleriaceae bacterium]
MPGGREYRHQPADSRKRGLPAIGFSIRIPDAIATATTTSIAPDRATLLTCRELDRDGLAVGELELGAFSAALIMDRDGILEQMVAVEADRALVAPASGRRESLLPFDYDGGASGYRADVVLLRDARGEVKPRMPYLAWCALGTGEIVDAGIFVTIRCARPEWPACEELLNSLRIVRQGGAWTSPAANDEMPHLPLVGRRRF